MSANGGARAGKKRRQPLEKWKLTRNQSIIKIDPDLMVVVHKKHGVQHFLIETANKDSTWKVHTVATEEEGEPADGPYEPVDQEEDDDDSEDENDSYGEEDDIEATETT